MNFKHAKKMNLKRKKIGIFFVSIAVAAIAALVIMLLWNVLIPTIIGWQAVNYWQAAGLMILSRLLLGGFGKFGGGHFYRHSRFNHDAKHMMNLHDKMSNMSREERREHIRKCMGMMDNNFNCSNKSSVREDSKPDEQ